jgi:hypothetical protein
MLRFNSDFANKASEGIGNIIAGLQTMQGPSPVQQAYLQNQTAIQQAQLQKEQAAGGMASQAASLLQGGVNDQNRETLGYLLNKPQFISASNQMPIAQLKANTSVQTTGMNNDTSIQNHQNDDTTKQVVGAGHDVAHVAAAGLSPVPASAMGTQPDGSQGFYDRMSNFHPLNGGKPSSVIGPTATVGGQTAPVPATGSAPFTPPTVSGAPVASVSGGSPSVSWTGSSSGSPVASSATPGQIIAGSNPTAPDPTTSGMAAQVPSPAPAPSPVPTPVSAPTPAPQAQPQSAPQGSPTGGFQRLPAPARAPVPYSPGAVDAKLAPQIAQNAISAANTLPVYSLMINAARNGDINGAASALKDHVADFAQAIGVPPDVVNQSFDTTDYNKAMHARQYIVGQMQHQVGGQRSLGQLNFLNSTVPPAELPKEAFIQIGQFMRDRAFDQANLLEPLASKLPDGGGAALQAMLGQTRQKIQEAQASEQQYVQNAQAQAQAAIQAGADPAQVAARMRGLGVAQ